MMSVFWFFLATFSIYAHYNGVEINWTALPAAQASAGLFLLMNELKNK